MLIGLLDVDNHNKTSTCFPNLPLMKLSTYHKALGDVVEMYDPKKHYDRVYKAKVFSFSKEPYTDIKADLVISGGTGYAIKRMEGKEIFKKEFHQQLNPRIEKLYPDYSLYGVKDTAYGFLTRGCPRGCPFCIVGEKEGLVSYPVAKLENFWQGQKNINLLDPNILACSNSNILLKTLVDSKAWIEFNQGLDVRFLTEDNIDLLKQMKIKHIHFAYDRLNQKNLIEKNLSLFKEKTGYQRSKVSVYVLTNFETTLEEDIERIMFIRSLNFNPYIMRYQKEEIKRGSIANKLARWVNNKNFFWKYPTFEDYLEAYKRGDTYN